MFGICTYNIYKLHGYFMECNGDPTIRNTLPEIKTLLMTVYEYKILILKINYLILTQ